MQTITKLWLVPSAKQRRDPCSGPPTDSTDYRKCVSNSPSIPPDWRSRQTKQRPFLTGQSWRVLKSGYTAGSPEEGFRRCFADGVNQSLISSARRLHMNKKRNLWWFKWYRVVWVVFPLSGGRGGWVRSATSRLPYPQGKRREATVHWRKMSTHALEKMTRDLFRAIWLAPRQKYPRNVVEMKEAMAAFFGSDSVAISCHCKRSKIILVKVWTEVCSL